MCRGMEIHFYERYKVFVVGEGYMSLHKGGRFLMLRVCAAYELTFRGFYTSPETDPTFDITSSKTYGFTKFQTWLVVPLT